MNNEEAVQRIAEHVQTAKEEAIAQVGEFFDKGGNVTLHRDDEVLGPRDCVVQIDDPGLDGTGYEHPAWHRGQEHLMEQVTARLLKVIEGKDDGAGVFGDKDLEKIRRWMLERL